MLLSQRTYAVWTTEASGTTQDLNAIYFVSDDTGFAVGNSGAVRQSIDGGTTWAGVALGTTVNLADVVFAGTQEGYFLGASYEVFKTTDGGASFAPLIFAGLPTTAVFRKGSVYGTTRVLAAYAGATGSSLFISFNGTAWATQEFPTLEITGTYVAPTAGDIYAWGRDTSSGAYIIYKAATQVYSGSTPIRDIIFIDTNNGYAVGNSGLVLKTTDAGLNWNVMTAPTANNLSSVFLITDTFGWAGGAAGTMLYTRSGAISWESYTITPAGTDINDIYVRSTGGNNTVQALAFAAGAGGKIFKLESPDITGSTPASKQQGWIGTVEVNGAGFMNGASVIFTQPGTTDADATIIPLSTTVVSDSKLISSILVSPEAAAGARDLMVVNPDLTVSKEVNGFTVQTRGAATVESIWIDGTKVSQALLAINPTAEIELPNALPLPHVSFEVHSTSGVTTTALNPRIIAFFSGGYHDSAVAAADLSVIDAQRIKVEQTYHAAPLPNGEIVVFYLYGEDTAGNVAVQRLRVRAAGSTPVNGQTVTGAHNGMDLAVAVEHHAWNMTRFPSNRANILLPPGEMIAAGANIQVMIYNAYGQLLWKKAIANTGGYVKKIPFTMFAADFPEFTRSAGIVTVLATVDGKIRANNQFALVPWQ